MNVAARRGLWTALVSLFAVGGAVAYARPDAVRELGLDVWNLNDLHDRCRHEARYRQDLDRRDVEVLRRISVKERIIREVIAGRMELIDAAAAFRRLNEDRPEYMALLRHLSPLGSDEECVCCNVISFVDSALPERDRRRAEVLARLRAELDEIRVGRLCMEL